MPANFISIWHSITAIFRRPLGVIGLNFFVLVLSMLLMPFGVLAGFNPIADFIYRILSIYYFVFVVVLVFNYYEQNLQPQETKVDSGDRPDSIGQEQPGA